MLEGGTETMSSRIDQRIVEMSFENHKFEKGINQSQGSLSKFADALKNMGGGKDFKGLENSVQSVTSSFSMLEQIGIGALRRIGDAAVSAGASLVKSLTIDQLSSGLDKYQQKIEAVQTMVSAGYDLDTVEKSMEQLMWFSDETSYSFADMAGNMAKFIASGVDLKTSEKAMQGIANWAAHSGKNSQAASIAMFNLSQAISMGYVDTLNWRSIMNQNMNTVMFKEIAIGVAEATGAIKEGQITIQNFDSGLKDKWFTNDVLLKTLEQYSGYAEKVKEVQEEMGFDTAKQAMDYMDAHADKYGDIMNQIGNAAFKAAQESKSFMDSINATMDAVSTGWMKTYEIIFGTLYEAKENFSALTEILWTVFAASAEVRNEMLQLVKDGGGIKALFQTLKNVAVVLLTPLHAISKAFDQFFPPKTATQWLSIISGIESLTKSMIMTEATADKIQRTFAGFFAVLDIGWDTVKFLGQSLREIVGIFIPLGDSLLDTTASFGDWLVGVNALIKQSGVFQYALLGVKIAAILIRDGLGSVISKISDFIHILWTTDKPLEFLGKTVGRIFSGLLETISTVITWISGKFTKSLSGVHKFLSETFNIDNDGLLGSLFELLKDFIGFLAGEATDGITTFGESIGKLNFSRIATFVTGGVLLLFINQLSNLTNAMAGVLKSTNTFITKFSKKLFGTTTKIKDLAYVFGILTVSLFVLSKIPWDEMKVGLLGLAGAMATFVVAYGLIQAITVWSSKALKGFDVVKSTFSIVSLAAGVAIMAVAITKLNKVATEGDIWQAVGVMAAMMALLAAYQLVSAFISTIPGQKAVAVKFTGMTFGILGLLGIVTVLNLVPKDALKSGAGKLVGMVALIAVIQALFAVVSRISGGNKVSINLLGMTGSLLGMLLVMQIVSLMDTRTISKGIGNILLLGGVIAGLQLMMNLAGKLGGGVKFRTNMMGMQMSLLSMLLILKLIDFIGQEKIQNGIKSLAKMAAIIVALEFFTALASRIAGGNKVQRILASVTITMFAFMALIGIVNHSTNEEIFRGLVVISAMLALIVGFEALMAKAAGLSGGVAALTSITGMIVTFVAIGGILALLAVGDQDALRQAAISVGMTVIAVGIMGAGLAVLLKHLSVLSATMTGVKGLLTNLLPGFVTLGVVIVATLALLGIIMAASTMMENISWSSIAKFAVGLGIVSALVVGFTMLANISGLAGGMAGLAGLIPGFAGMIGLVAATAGFFYMLGPVLKQIDALNWSSFPKFLEGLAWVSVLFVGMTLLAGPLAAVGVIAPGALLGVLTVVGALATVILGFALLAEVMDMFYSNGADGLIKGMDYLVLVGEGIGRFLGAIAGGFSAETMAIYGKGIADFADAVKGIDATAFDGLENLAKIVQGLSSISKSKGDQAAMFGEQLQGLITAFEGISVADANKTSAVVAALAPMAENLTILADAAKSIPNSGGFIGDFMGDNDINVFGEQLQGFIRAFARTTEAAVSKASTVLEAMTPMIGNLKAFASAADKIPNSGGFMEAFMGGNDIDDFGAKLVSFVGAFKAINPSDATKASSALTNMQPMITNLKAFATLAEGLPNSGGMVTWFTGDNDIQDFVDKIALFVKKLNGLNSGDIETAHTNLSVMTTEMLPGLNKFASLSNNLNPDGLSQLTFFAYSLKDFVKILKGVDVSVVAPALKALEDISTSFRTIGSEVMANATESFNNNKAPFQASIAKLLDDIISLVNSKKKPIETAFTGVISNALSQSRKYIGEFVVLGGDLMRGLQRGIDANKATATVAATNMTKNVIRATRGGFQVQSPSKIFEGIGKWLPAGLGKGIENNTKVAVLAGINMAESVEEAVRDTTGVHSETKIYKGMGNWVSKSFGSGVEQLKGWAVQKGSELGLDTTSGTIKGAVQGMVQGEGALTTGVGNLLDLLTGTSATNAAATAASKMGDLSGNKGGSSFSDGVAKGIKGGSGKVKKTAAELADDAFKAFNDRMTHLVEYELISPEEELSKWKEFAAAQAEGSLNQLKANKKVAELSFAYSKTWIDKEKYYKKMSLEEELAAWLRIQGKKELTKAQQLEVDRELFRIRNELMQNEYQNALDFIEEEKYYKRMSKAEELAKMQELQIVFEDNAELRKSINREIFRLETEMADARIAHEKELEQLEKDRLAKREAATQKFYTNSKEWVDEEKNYNRLTLTDELKAWKKIQKATEKGSDQRKQANREVYRMEKEISDLTKKYYEDVDELEKTRTEKRNKAEGDYYNKTKENQKKLESDIKSLTDAYESAVKSRAQALYSAWGLFDKVEIPQVDGQELLKNLEDQVVAFDQWQAQLSTLAGKGVSESLVNELRDMGPKSLSQIVALNALTGPELDKYVALWNKKSVEAKDQAVSELESMKTETDLKIEELTKIAHQNLLEYTEVWADANKTINEETDTALDKLYDAWDGALKSTNKNIDSELSILEKEWKDSLDTIDTDSAAELKRLEDLFNTNITRLASDTVGKAKGLRKDFGTEIKGMVDDTQTQMNKLQGMVNSMEGMAKQAADAASRAQSSADAASRSLAQAAADSEKAGSYVVDGFTKGMDKNSNKANLSGTAIARTAIAGLHGLLMIKSPSRRTMETGRYFVEGLAGGIKKFANTAFNASTRLGSGALDAMSLAMEDMPDLASDTNTFSIRPVLDLSDVRSGMGSINSMFNGVGGLDLAASMGLLPQNNSTNQNGILNEIRNSLLEMSQQEIDLTGTLSVQVTNDKGEIVGIAETAIKDILRRESR